MCIAIYQPAGAKISVESLRECWVRNSDGAGFAYVDGGRVVVEKGFMTLKQFGTAYKAALDKFGEKSPFLVHFRIRTHGNKDADNTHPFNIKGGVLIHNGTISGTGAGGGISKSDTALFCEKFGNDLTFENVEKTKKQLEDALGWNKLVMLYDDGRHQIVNEKEGIWHERVWFSNTGFRTINRYSNSNVRDLCDWE